ncbi:MAG: ATP-binding protein [Deltaproteobacteria bacterium]
MDDKKGPGVTFEALRMEAERIVKERETESVGDNELQLVRLTHELEVHQVELELQNEELQRANKELEASRKEFVDLHQFAPVAFVTVNEKSLIEQANDAAARMFAGSKHFLAGRLFSLLIYPPDQDVYFSCLEKIALNEGKGSCELRLNAEASGRLVHVKLQAAAKHDWQGLIHWRLALVDITEPKRLEDELRRSRDELELRVKERTAELERSNRELQDFAFIASHDLQEPLRKIRTFGSLIEGKSGHLLPEQSRDFLVRMQKAAERMQTLLGSLLDYSWVATKSEQFKETDLNRSLKAALSNLEVLIEEKGVQVDVEELPSLKADRNQMIQLFQNLIANAAKFNGNDRSPFIKIYARPVEGSKGVEAYRVFVEDNGIGFKEKHLDKLFAPFQRLHGRTEYEGVGMGLAICRKIVERHGGEITAKSELGRGATFIVTLPVNRNKG